MVYRLQNKLTCMRPSSTLAEVIRCTCGSFGLTNCFHRTCTNCSRGSFDVQVRRSIQNHGRKSLSVSIHAENFTRRSLTQRLLIGLVLGVSLVGSIGTMMGTFYTPPEKPIQKHLFWLVGSWFVLLICRSSRLDYQGFNACQAVTLSPLFLFSPAILSRAALYTVGIVGSLSYVGATAR